MSDIVARERNLWEQEARRLAQERDDLRTEAEYLRGLLVEANDAFDETSGDYPKELVEGEPWREYRTCSEVDDMGQQCLRLAFEHSDGLHQSEPSKWWPVANENATPDSPAPDTRDGSRSPE